MRGNVGNRAQLALTMRQFEPDCVCYLAAQPLVHQVDANPAEATDSMTTGLTNCLELIRRETRSIRFVYTSSSMVYGHFTADPITEDAPTTPVNLYGGLKLAGEILTRTYLDRTSHEAVIVRPSGVYGPTDIHGRVVQKCCEAAVTGEPFVANNPESTFVDFTWVGDLAKGILLAATSPTAGGETFNLTLGKARSLSDLIGVVSCQTGGALRVVATDTELAYRPRRGALGIEKARRLLGYAPQVDLELGVQKYLNFIRQRLVGSTTTLQDLVST